MLETDSTFRIDVMSVVRVGGEIDVASAPELAKWLEAVPEGVDLVVDLSGVTFLDSTGLGVLVGAWNRCNNSGPPCRLALVVSTAEVERLLEVAGLSEVFECFPTIEAATAR